MTVNQIQIALFYEIQPIALFIAHGVLCCRASPNLGSGGVDANKYARADHENIGSDLW